MKTISPVIIFSMAIGIIGCSSQPALQDQSNSNNLERPSKTLQTQIETECLETKCTIKANGHIFTWDQTFFADSYKKTRNIQIYRYQSNSGNADLHEQWAIDIVNQKAGLISSVDLLSGSQSSINLNPHMKSPEEWGERSEFIKELIKIVETTTPITKEAVEIGEARLVEGDFGLKYVETEMKVLRPVSTVIVTFGAYDASNAKIGEFIYSGTNFVKDEIVKIKAMGTVPPNVSISSVKRLKTQIVD